METAIECQTNPRDVLHKWTWREVLVFRQATNHRAVRKARAEDSAQFQSTAMQELRREMGLA